VNKAGFAPAMGRKNHLGKRIPFSELPPDCQRLVMQDYREIWNLPSALDMLKLKLHPSRFTAMSGKMASIVAFIVGEVWTNPALQSLTVTSDGFVLGTRSGDIGANDFIGAKTDLLDNWKNLLTAAGLSEDEKYTASHLFSAKVALN